MADLLLVRPVNVSCSLVAFFVITFFWISSVNGSDANESLSGDSVVVTRDFEFTAGPSAVSHMNHTWTIPAGVYRAAVSDSSGTYYIPPTGWLWLKARHRLQMHCVLCRRDSTFLICSQVPGAAGSASSGLPEGLQLIGKAFFGSKPQVWDSLPPEFRKVVESR